MEDPTPLQAAWRAVRRAPSLWLLALGWDLARWGLTAALGHLGLTWFRWEFNLGWQSALAGERWFIRLVLPPALPGSEQLGALYGPLPPAQAGWSWFTFPGWLPVAAMFLLEPLVRAGYMNLANGVLHGVRPGWRGFWRGVRRYGPGFLLLAALWLPVGLWASSGGQSLPPALLAAVETVLTFCFYMAQFLIVTDDAHPLQALPAAPLMAWGHLPALAGPVVLSLAISGALTGGLSALGLLHPLVTGPLWSVAGTALALHLLAALQDGISRRAEPNMPWACRQCGVQNQPGAGACAACGRPRQGAPEA